MRTTTSITTDRPSITGLSPASGVLGFNTAFSLTYTGTRRSPLPCWFAPARHPCFGHGPTADWSVRSFSTASLHRHEQHPQPHYPSEWQRRAARLLHAVSTRQCRSSFEGALHPTHAVFEGSAARAAYASPPADIDHPRWQLPSPSAPALRRQNIRGSFRVARRRLQRRRTRATSPLSPPASTSRR